MYYYCTNTLIPKTLPDVNDVVFVEIVKFSNNNTYCKLLEYNDLEGFLPDTELDRRVHDPRSCFDHNMIYPMVVTSNMRNGNVSIDLSYKKVQKDTRNELTSQFLNIKKLYTMLNEFCFFTKVEFELAQRSILYPKLNTESSQHLTNSGDMYKEYLRNPKLFFSSNKDLSIEMQINAFIENTLERLSISQMVIYQNFRLWVIQSHSLEILREILSGFKEENCEVVYVSSPKYQLTIKCNSEEEKLAIVNKFIEYIKSKQLIYKIKFELDESVLIHNQEFILHPLNMTTEVNNI